MSNQKLFMQQKELVDKGKLKVRVRSVQGAKPIEGAQITISYTGEPASTLMQINTNTVGVTDAVELNAPALEYSQKPSEVKPYSEYTLQITAPGFVTITISGTEILPKTTAIQEVSLEPTGEKPPEETIVIADHTLYAQYPPKIAEAEIKPVRESGEIVLSKVVVPEFVVVHDGSPNDPTAPNYYIRYKDYIKNVASSEIYATWPKSTIEANILAIMSFTLNRVYTEWYRNKGFNFTITSSTAFDHKFIYGRNVFAEISTVVDEIFSSYLSRPNVKQPILTQYCDGQRVTCPKWLSQWGSRDLGEQGYSQIDILRYYYGNNMYINEAPEVSGVPSSFAGTDLTIGSTGEKVRQLQEQLNTISNTYTLIPKEAVDGSFGEKTQSAVKQLQSIFDLPVTGVVDYPTWYKIQDVYVGVTRIGELV